MGKLVKRKRKDWSTPAWNEFTGKVWDAGDTKEARALVDEWVDKALGVLSNMWLPQVEPKEEKKVFSKDNFLKNVEFVGGILSKHLNKPPNACKGLVILSIAAKLGDDRVYQMKNEDLPSIITNNLKERLLSLRVNNVDAIIKDLLSRVIKRQP